MIESAVVKQHICCSSGARPAVLSTYKKESLFVGPRSRPTHGGYLKVFLRTSSPSIQPVAGTVLPDVILGQKPSVTELDPMIDALQNYISEQIGI